MVELTIKERNVAYSVKYRNKDPSGYRAYQREYKQRRYEDPQIRTGILKNMKNKYYYSGDPLPCIRKLFQQ
jgi:hypothetical protein|tara:strand:- start:304 stop:516 length:213 start_codon:yes stop_codon:yes gene_type:complete